MLESLFLVRSTCVKLIYYFIPFNFSLSMLVIMLHGTVDFPMNARPPAISKLLSILCIEIYERCESNVQILQDADKKRLIKKTAVPTASGPFLLP